MTEHPKFVVHEARGRDPLEDGTFFVLRDSDLLAPAVMWSYVHEIQTLFDLDRARSFLTDDERTYLTTLKAEVQTRAERWQRQGKGRLPD